jgi:hypothetical protein
VHIASYSIESIASVIVRQSNQLRIVASHIDLLRETIKVSDAHAFYVLPTLDVFSDRWRLLFFD